MSYSTVKNTGISPVPLCLPYRGFLDPGQSIVLPDSAANVQASQGMTGIKSQVKYSDLPDDYSGDVNTSYVADDLELQGPLVVPAGSGTGLAKTGGTVHVDTAKVGNVGGGTDVLITYTLPADVLAEDGDCLEIEAWGTYGATTNAKTLKLLFGATELFASGAVVSNGGEWRIRAKVFRTGGALAEAIAEYQSSATYTVTNPPTPKPVTHIEPTEDLTGAIVIKCTALSAGSADDDVVQEGMNIRYYPAP